MSHIYKELFRKYLAKTSAFPLELEFTHASGLYLYNQAGESFADFISGISVSNLGHSHPQIVQAVCQQASRHMHLMVYGEYVQSSQVQLAELIISTLPESLDQIYFTNSGAEATEGALKLAKRYTGRSRMVACSQSYHGSTHGALSVMGNEYYKRPFRPLLPDVHFIEYAYLPDLEHIDHHTACVILETVQAESGIRVPDKEYMQALRARCTATGALLILDEIQSGMGRTGRLWAFEHFEIVPDIVLTAKALGGGLPLGGFAANSRVMLSLSHDPLLGHITTFGGHPVSCAAGLAHLRLLLEGTYIDDVEHKAQRMIRHLVHPSIIGIRHKGLLMAVQLPDFDFVQGVIQSCLHRGLIVDWFLHCTHSIRLAPPLSITYDEIDSCMHILLEAIHEEHQKRNS